MTTNQKTADERQRLIGFITVMTRFIESTQGDGSSVFGVWAQPTAWERVPLSGIRMVVRDLLEWSQAVTADQLAALDAELERSGFPTLTELRQDRRRAALAVLTRRRIRNESEWHILNEILADTADRMLTAGERVEAERLLSEFECSRKRTRSGPS